jgi:pantetheine-phosphate adenylyltransferase
MLQKIALYPGSFDCLTFGHVDVIERSSRIFDRVIVAVAANIMKNPFFTLDERVEMLVEGISHLDNVSVDRLEGLTIDYARKNGIPCLIRGLRAVSDFEWELQLASANKRLAPEIETIFLASGLGFEFISSSMAKDIVANGGDVSPFVPPHVAAALQRKFAR